MALQFIARIESSVINAGRPFHAYCLCSFHRHKNTPDDVVDAI